MKGWCQLQRAIGVRISARMWSSRQLSLRLTIRMNPIHLRTFLYCKLDSVCVATCVEEVHLPREDHSNEIEKTSFAGHLSLP